MHCLLPYYRNIMNTLNNNVYALNGVSRYIKFIVYVYTSCDILIL